MADPMNLEHVRAIEEHPTHFVVDHEIRGRFRLAKSALPDDVAESIRSVAKGKAAAAQALANQPEVDGVTRAAFGDAGADSIIPVPEQMEEQPASLPTPWGDMPIESLQPQPPQPLPEGYEQVDGPVGTWLQRNASYQPPAAPVVPEPIQSRPEPATPGVPTQSVAQAEVPQAQVTPAAIAPSRAAPRLSGAARPSADALPAVPGDTFDGSDDAKKLNRATQDHRDAIKETGRIAQHLALEQKRAQDDANQVMGGLADDHNKSIAANEKRLQGIADDIARNPLRKQDVGLSGVIGMALGAFGASLAGTPNFAMQIVNKRIDDDLAIQKANRSDKYSQIAFYQQKGLSLDNAYKMAKADALAKAAGQMQSAALQAGSDQAVQTANAASAELMTQSVKMMQEAHINDFRIKTAPFVLAHETHSRDLNDQMVIAHKNLLEANAQAKRAKVSAGASQQQLENNYLSGVPIPIVHRGALSPHARDAGVQIAGQLYAAHDKDAATKARTAVSAASEMKAEIQKMRDFRANNGRAFTPGDSATSAELQRFTQLAIKSAGELGTLDSGSQAFMDAMVKDPGSIFTSDATINAGLDALDGWADTRKNSVLGAQLIKAPLPRAAKIRE